MEVSFSTRQRRLAGTAILGLIGFLLLSIQVHNVLNDVIYENESPLTALMEFLFPGLLTMGLIWVAWRLWTDASDGAYALRIAQWSGGSIVAGLALMTWALGIQLIVQNGTDLYVLVTNSALIAAVGGTVVGLYSVEQSKQQRKLEKSEERYRSLTEDVLDSSDVAIFILDADLHVVWVNEATERYFGLDRGEIIGEDARTVVTERLQHRVEDTDEFRGRILDSYDDNTSAEHFECHVLGDERREERWLEHWSRPIESGLYEGGRIEHYNDITDQKQTTKTIEWREETLRELHDVFIAPDQSFEEQVRQLLDVGRRILDVEHAIATRIDDGEHVVENASSADGTFESGDTESLSETYSELVETTTHTCEFVTISENHSELRDRRWYTELGIEYYIGIPIFVQDELYGTLEFIDTGEKSGDSWEVTLLQLMGNWMGHELERERRERERERELRETREQFTSLVEDVEDYSIFQLDSEGHVTSWNRGAKQNTGYREEEVLGAHISMFYTNEAVAEGRPQELLRQAAREGRVEAEGWQVRKDGERFWASVVLTALRDEGGDLRGFTEIVRDMTERKQREQALEHERERLEFLNRLIRHNLLNDLNVVRARAELLDGRTDPEVTDHLQVVQSRIQDMTDLVATMRAFMKVVVDHEDHQLEPVDLDTVLREEVAKASDAPEDVAVTLPDTLPSVEVQADDLLPEVFENLLTNAVLHNDKDTPVIDIETEIDGQCAVVHIADNGPGVPDSIKEAIFEKGQKYFDSPGTGFGLYLVHELVEAYGGSIDVADNDPEGAVFTVRLPLASPTTQEVPKRHDGEETAG